MSSETPSEGSKGAVAQFGEKGVIIWGAINSVENIWVLINLLCQDHVCSNYVDQVAIPTGFEILPQIF